MPAKPPSCQPLRKGQCLALSLLLGLAMEDLANACSCGPNPPPREALASASAVFAGSVTKIEQEGEWGYRTVSMAVFEAWKGVSSSRVIVKTGSGNGDCGFGFKIGDDYLVYARGDEATGFHTSDCTRTRGLSNALFDLARLGNSTYDPPFVAVQLMVGNVNSESVLFASLVLAASSIWLVIYIIRQRPAPTA